MLNLQDKQNKFERLRKQAEKLIQQQTGSLEQTDIVNLFHEMEASYKELEIQAKELKRTQVELALMNQEHAQLYEFAPCGYVTLNPKGIITRANLTAARLLDTNRTSLYLSPLSSHFANGWETTYLSAQRKAAQTGERQIVELPLKQEKDSFTWVQASIQAVFDKQGSVTQWRVVLDDIADRKLMEQKLSYLATTDELTGLWNRRFFMDAANQEMEKAKRYHQFFSLLMLDIDDFKTINDKHGHEAGDRLLNYVGKYIQNNLRKVDTPGRYGGDEFAVIMPQTDLNSAYVIGEKLRIYFDQNPLIYRNNNIHFTVSIGITEYDPNMTSIEKMIKIADDALYKAKKEGRNMTFKISGNTNHYLYHG